VNIITGEVVVDQQDFVLQGRIPLKWNRHYGSQNPRRGLCGYGWETPADARLEFVGDGTISFYDGTPGVTVFSSLPLTGSVEDPVAGAILDQTHDAFTVKTKSGLIYCFPKPQADAGELLVDRISDLSANTIQFIRKAGNLTEIQDGSERRIEVTSHNGLIRQMLLHHPREAAPRMLVRYAYSDADDLAMVFDALEAPYRFFYRNHCLTQHTDRNGLSFYYQYDELSTAGRCVRSFGDNGLYDSRLEYSTAQTRVTDSFGHSWTIEYDPNQLPIKEIDPSGGVTLYEYDEFGRTTAVVNPEGNRTEYVYDDRGNLLKLTRPDGQAIITEFNAANNVVRITDARAAAWEQEWDSRNLLIRQMAPLGGQSRYEYDSQGQLVAFVDPLGARTSVAFDAHRNVTRLTDALGRTTEFAYDVLGNMIGKTDSLGRCTKYAYDLKGRLTQVILPSGVATV
jgi:YD repeat-containing protein